MCIFMLHMMHVVSSMLIILSVKVSTSLLDFAFRTSFLYRTRTHMHDRLSDYVAGYTQWYRDDDDLALSKVNHDRYQHPSRSTGATLRPKPVKHLVSQAHILPSAPITTTLPGSIPSWRCRLFQGVGRLPYPDKRRLPGPGVRAKMFKVAGL